MIGVQCLCGKILMVPVSAIGKAGNCPFCRQGMRLVAPGYEGSGEAFREKLVIEAGPEKVGEMYPLGGPGPIEIGKLANKDIPLHGERVSRNHCRLVRGDSGWRIEDTGSTNGIYVNAKRVPAQDLKDRDIIQVGDFALSYTVDGSWDPTQIAPPTPGNPEPPAPPKPAAPPATRQDAPPPPAPSPENLAFSTGKATDAKPEAASARILSDDALYVIAEDAPVAVLAPEATPEPPPLDGLVCPSCKKRFPYSVKVCVACGVDLRTGRAILTSSEGDLDRTYTRSERIIWWVSWFLPLGLFPIASEALGTLKPYVVWAFSLLTVFLSCWFWAYEVSDSPQMQSAKDYLLWSGDGKPDVGYLSWAYNFTSYGDQPAFQKAVEQLEANKPAPGRKPPTRGDIMLAAHNSLTPRQQALGHFLPYQLITHQFLHNDLMHLITNLAFLLVIGARVNALIGNSATLAFYPLLGVVAGVAQVLATRHDMPMSTLGASGAIMGLSGMYLILMPLHKIHMAAWVRLAMAFVGIAPLAILVLFLFQNPICLLVFLPVVALLVVLVTYGLRLRLWMFALRGFWVVLFFIAFDVLAAVRASTDGVAHWEHLGGFLGGMAIGLVLLLARAVNCHGGDIFSGLLGSRAYALIGQPNPNHKRLLERIW